MIRKWLQYGFTKQEIESCQAPINQHNMVNVRAISAIAMGMMVVFSFFPLFVEGKLPKAIGHFIAAAVECLVYLYARRKLRQNDVTQTNSFFAFCVFFLTLMFFGIQMGVLEMREGLAANFMIFLICGQITFVFPPFRLLMVNVLVIGTFIGLSVCLKSPVYWNIDAVNAIVSGICSQGFGWYVSRVLLKEMLASRHMEEERNFFREESETDALTGLSNRRYFFTTAQYYLDAWLTAHKTVCMLMIDLDFFKNYNDNYGHPEGDKVLAAVGGVLKQVGEAEGIFPARVGGEEFAVLFAENRQAEAERFAKKLGQMIYDLKIPHAYSDVAPYITASIGLYLFRGERITLEQMYQKADSALYHAKWSGRNAIVRMDSRDEEYVVLDKEA
ncbi:GGDEF domain-containing protein [Eubacteriales bacterium OttesenSCG-928-M02]|nr:GGDEF domain-containing protein [Eubacteriales bacterium OttesenSCG-928-M02]